MDDLLERETERTVGSSDGLPSSTATSSSEGAGFITHKVSKLDTLAGLAVRYNVSVADIKRFNNLLSDSALYARESILVPTKLVPIGEEIQAIFAQIAVGIGRDPVLNAEANLYPASSSVARVARALHLVSGESYPSEPVNNGPWWCQCGTCEDDDYENSCRTRTLASSSGHPGDVELTELAGEGTFLLPPSISGPTRFHTRRRKARASDSTSEDGDHVPQLHNHCQHSQYHSRAAQHSSGNGAELFSWKHLSQIGKAIGESAFIQKIKQAANQPALASPGMSSLADAADGVLGSIKGGLVSKRTSQNGFNAAAATPLRALKAAGKAD